MAVVTAGSSPSPISWACSSASSSCWSLFPIKTRRRCKPSPARCETRSVCRTLFTILASSKARGCRLATNSRTLPTSDPRIHPSRRRRMRQGSSFESDQAFALSAASLRQALQNMPELAEASKHIMIEEHAEGLNIEIVDQDGRSMFPEWSKEPYERTRKVIQKIAGPLKDTPYRIAITGHTSTSRTLPQAGYGSMEPFGRPGQYGAPNPGSKRAIRPPTSTRWRAGPIPIHFSRRTGPARRIAA